MAENEPIDLEELLNREVVVRLKGGRKLRGTITECDDYMNLVLKNAEEYKGEESWKEHELVVVKGGNIRSITS